VKLNLGCGFNKIDGYVNIDSDPEVIPDLLRNIERGLPFSDSVVDEIFTSHTLEHINPDLIHFVISECWRVLKNGGLLKVIVPIGKGLTNSPEHKCMFDHKSYIFFTIWNERYPYKFVLVQEKVTGKDIYEQLEFVLKVEKEVKK